jgi:hypothetical protein
MKPTTELKRMRFEACGIVHGLERRSWDPAPLLCLRALEFLGLLMGTTNPG